MDGAEFGDLVDRVGQFIENGTPIDAEYWRGYFQGIKVHYRHTTGSRHSLERDTAAG